MTTELPSNLSNLVGQYQDEKTYISSVNSSNQLARNQIILDELANVDIQEIIQFKLATQLSKNYILKYVKSNKVDLNTLNGIFNILLNHYSYEELLTPDKIDFRGDIQEAEHAVNVKELAQHFIYLSAILTTFDFYNPDVMKQKLGDEVFKEVEFADSNNGEYDADAGSLAEVFTEAYDLLLKQYPDIPTTISWDVNKELYIKVLKEYINGMNE